MTHNPSNPTIEPWQLTAYALNELDAADTAIVEQALESDAALRIDFEQIQQTLTAVRSALASSATGVALSATQTAALADQVKQMVAPSVLPATVKLAERPFYRRKRFAALLATAAAIPIAVTWMPTLFENGVQLADHIPSTTLPSSAYLAEEVQHVLKDNDAPVAESTTVATSSGGGVGLIRDVDISSVPEMNLKIVKGSKKEVERARKLVDEVRKQEGEVSEVADSAPIAYPTKEVRQELAARRSDRFGAVDSKKSGEAAEDRVLAVKEPTGPQGGTILLGGIKITRDQLYKKNELGQANNELMMTQTPRIIIPEEEEETIGVVSLPSIDALAGAGAGEGGGMGFGGGVGGGHPGAGKSGAGPHPIPSIAAGMGGGMAGVVAEGMPSTKANIVGKELAASLDKSVSGTDRELIPLYQLPAELRANAPHLYRAPAPVETGSDRFEKIVETPFVETQKAPLSTFSIDVDTASYSKIRQTLMQGNRLPNPSMVRIEEMINYFEYGYAGPQDERPFAAHMTIDRCPWNTEHQLVRVGLQAKKIEAEKRVKANIVFLLDVSGSMNEPNKLPLVKKTLSMMVNQLTENDRVAIVVYAGAAGCVLPSTCGAEKQNILSSLEHLNAGGSTNGGQGIQLAYSIAKEHFIPGGANRVILCTDGDFNVGVTGDDALVAMMQENAKSNIFLTCLGYGAGNYNDSMMEKISNKGNGIYAMIDDELEARRMMVEQFNGTLVTVAKDVKIQVDFNPAKVAGYRLIGYEDRRLANKDFDNDQKDAGEIGAGHRVTALYEVIPAGKWGGVVPPSEGESSKYLPKPQAEPKFEKPAEGEFSAEVLTLKVRYKEPEGSVSTKQEFVLKDSSREDNPSVDRDMQWATSVAEFGLLLRRSEMAPHADWSEMLERATSAAGGDAYRLECLAMMRKARSMHK